MSEGILIVGCGQIGVFASAAIEARGMRVLVADRRPAEGFFARFGARRAGKILPIDVADQTNLTRLIRERDITTIVSALGETGAAFESAEDAARRAMIEAPLHLAEAALAGGAKRLVHVSSFAVYGRQPKERLDEGAELLPATAYGAAKMEIEARLRERVSGAAELVLLRPCGVYGPVRFNSGSHSAQLLDTMLFAASRGKPVTLRWSPADATEFLYVKDLAEAIAALLARPPETGEEVYNIGSGVRPDGIAIRKAVQALYPRAVIELEPVPTSTVVPMPLLDCARIERAIGFRARYNILDGLRDQACATLGLAA